VTGICITSTASHLDLTVELFLLHSQQKESTLKSLIQTVGYHIKCIITGLVWSDIWHI